MAADDMKPGGAAVRVIMRHDEFGQKLREVRGVDFDTVYARALDVRNAIPVVKGPHVVEQSRDKKSGEWVVLIGVRESE